MLGFRKKVGFSRYIDIIKDMYDEIVNHVRMIGSGRKLFTSL